MTQWRRDFPPIATSLLSGERLLARELVACMGDAEACGPNARGAFQLVTRDVKGRCWLWRTEWNPYADGGRGPHGAVVLVPFYGPLSTRGKRPAWDPAETVRRALVEAGEEL